MIQKNPYKFAGPLSPARDMLVCISRRKEVDKVISGIRRGDYWTILGPRQIGKTTFLNLLRSELSGYRCAYIDFEVSPQTNNAFYEWIIDELIEKIPAEPVADTMQNRKQYGPELNFYNFLKTFKPGEDEKIVLFFDEIERSPAVASFLHIWRKVFHERCDQPELNKYSVIIAGSVDLIALTIGPTSPFNIALKLYLDELTTEESGRLINDPCNWLGIQVDEAAKAKLIRRTSGHPQLLQHLCSLLVEQALEEKKEIAESDVDSAIDRLFIENSNLKLLGEEVRNKPDTKRLIKRILEDEKIEYFPHHKLSIAGSGPITQKEKYCALRNNIYREWLTKTIDLNCSAPESTEEAVYITNVFLNEMSADFVTTEHEKSSLKCLFDPDAVTIEIIKNDKPLDKLNLEWKEQLIFCYLIYKNYKAINEGIPSWKKIPHTYEYRLSSNIENNKQQKPEWEVFEQALKEKGVVLVGDEIRGWILNLRKELSTIGAVDLIPVEKGRGSGYLLKGTVNISPQN